MTAPPMPCTARAPSRTAIVRARAQAREAAVKTTIPIVKTRRRPRRSAIEPALSVTAASAIV
ncbi:MAG: hypothetical protein JO016_07265 [Actinobacteria bacterium]|nr:hypothetical protein [Actinomycetota bacterium]